MIWFFTPYSFEKKLFEAYDAYMQLISDPEDWGCLMDGDAAFLLSDFGNQIQEYIDKYPGAGLFTCYASRCPYVHQMKYISDWESDSIHTVFRNTQKQYQNDHLKVLDTKRRICGHLMVIKKKTWMKYRDQISDHAANANIQAVDTAISDILLRNNEQILLMEGIQVFHYYRQYSMSEKHILSDKLTVVIRTHDRPTMFKRCIDSVRKQTHKNIDIVVGVDTPGSLEYASEYNPTRIVKFETRKRLSHDDFPANEYISKLIETISDGFILVLDDDNFIADPQGVEKLFAQIDKEWCIYMIRYRYPDGRLFPNDQLFRAKIVQNGGVDWASCVFHARFKNVSKSKPLYNADYYFINSLVTHAKTTKWINLDLVHTDTPGLDGKTELEMPSLATHSGNAKTDVVYVLGKGSSWGDNEIRFSIRSFVKHFKDLRNIVVVGECPVFLKNVINIPCRDEEKVNKDARMMLKIKAACQDSRVSDNFILCTDDTLILRDLDTKDFTGWNDGPISYDAAADLKEHKRIDVSTLQQPVSDWFSYVYNTGLELKRRNLPDDNYDRAHCPQPINKAEFLEVMKGWNMIDNHYTISNIYNNSTKIFKGENIAGRNLKVYHPPTTSEIDQLASGKICMNYNDTGLNENMKQWLYARFPDATIHETFITDPDRRKTVQKWFETGCNYEAGIQIFKHFAPKNRNLIRFFELKHNNEISDRKLKYTLQLWLR